MSQAAYSTGAEIKEVSTSQLVTLVASYWQASTNIAAMRSNEKAYKRYQSKKWRAFRESFLKENPLCKNFEDDPLFYDKNNLQALCKRCHSRKTAKEDGAFGNKKKDYKDY